MNKEDPKEILSKERYPVPIEVGNLKYFVGFDFSSTNQRDMMPFTGCINIAYSPSLDGLVLSHPTIEKYLGVVLKKANNPDLISEIVAEDISTALETDDIVVSLTELRDHEGKEFKTIPTLRGVFTDNSSNSKKYFLELLREN